MNLNDEGPVSPLESLIESYEKFRVKCAQHREIRELRAKIEAHSSVEVAQRDAGLASNGQLKKLQYAQENTRAELSNIFVENPECSEFDFSPTTIKSVEAFDAEFQREIASTFHRVVAPTLSPEEVDMYSLLSDKEIVEIILQSLS